MESNAAQELKEARDELEACTTQNETLLEDLASLQADRLHLSRVIDEMQTAMDEMDEIPSGPAEMRALQATITARDEHIAVLEHDLSECHTRITELESDQARVNEEGDRLTRLQAEYEAVQRDMASLTVASAQGAGAVEIVALEKAAHEEIRKAETKAVEADRRLVVDIAKEHAQVSSAIDALFDEGAARQLTKTQVEAAKGDLQGLASVVAAATAQLQHERQARAAADTAHEILLDDIKAAHERSLASIRAGFDVQLGELRRHYEAQLSAAAVATEHAQQHAAEARGQLHLVDDAVGGARREMEAMQQIAACIQAESQCLMQGLGSVCGDAAPAMFGRYRPVVSAVTQRRAAAGAAKELPDQETDLAVTQLLARLKDNGFVVKARFLEGDRWQLGTKRVQLRVMSGVLSVAGGGGWLPLLEFMRHHTKELLT